MPIQISSFATRPAVDINEVHLVELRINLTEEQVAKARVRIVYRLFGRDQNGAKHWDTDQGVLTIDDAFTEAAARAAQGDLVLAQALGSIEAAVAALLQQTGQVGTATVI